MNASDLQIRRSSLRAATRQPFLVGKKTTFSRDAGVTVFKVTEEAIQILDGYGL